MKEYITTDETLKGNYEMELQELGFSKTADGVYVREGFFIEWTTDFYPTPTWVCYIAEDGDIVDGVAGYDTPMEAWEGMLEEIELVSNRRSNGRQN